MREFKEFIVMLIIVTGTLAFGWLALTAQQPFSQIGGVVGFLLGIIILLKITGEPKAETWEEIDKTSREGGYW